MEIKPYTRKVQYYETDAMGIIHHANYIHWFEEARIDFMEQMGYSYQRMDEEGVGSPVIGLACNYKTPVRFGDTVVVHTTLTEFRGVRMTVAYTITDAATGDVRCTGETRHCFVNREGRPLSLKKVKPELYGLFVETMPKQAKA